MAISFKLHDVLLPICFFKKIIIPFPFALFQWVLECTQYEIHRKYSTAQLLYRPHSAIFYKFQFDHWIYTQNPVNNRFVQGICRIMSTSALQHTLDATLAYKLITFGFDIYDRLGTLGLMK